MYSDIDSDSEEAATKSYLRISSRPYLRLYDKDEAEARAHELRGRVREKVGQPPSVADRSFSKVYRILRFFISYEGFYTGYLDLTGRHIPRFLSLHSRWNSYLADFLPITLDAKQITVTVVESRRDPQLYTDYEFSDTTRWDTFRKKWRIPATAFMDYSALLMHTTEILRTIGVNPSPRIQKLCLVDLPPELLDSVFRHTDMHEERLAPTFIWSRCSFLPHLERLCLSHIHLQPASIGSLANALRAVANTSGLRLTHFKLHTRRGITDAGVLILLDSIQGAPLKVLVLEGLAEAEPPLFERIAEMYEQMLVALTLVRRASDRQLRNQPVIWPRPAWEYGPHLSGLTSLEHFGWNSACDYLTIGTSVLHTFEQNFPVDPYGYPVAGEDDYIESLGSDALPFAAHCPSLKTFTSHENFSLANFISRTSAGSILVKPFDRAEHSIHDRYDIRQWNPSTMFGHAWPHVIPISTDTEPSDA